MNQIGIIGLAVMGRSLALNMADHGYQVAGFNRSYEVTKQMIEASPHKNFHGYRTLQEMVSSLEKPRRIMMMIKAGKPVDSLIEQLLLLLDKGDIIMDGGNSFFEDTIRRESYLRSQGIHYFGVGVSGGEDGARFGPSMMPGGDPAAYFNIGPILETISAKADDGKPCCMYIGPNGAGHYVKMVHNGIEYADMQMIAEAYLLLKYVRHMNNQEMADVFDDWNQGTLNSFLIKITADILREHDDQSDNDLIDQIKDASQQKGTGRWTSIEALKQGVDVSMITASGNARVMSNNESRPSAAQYFHDAKADNLVSSVSIEDIRSGLYAAKMIAYAQGFDLLKQASNAYHWDLKLGGIASIFRAGCIIQARFLNQITDAYERNQQLHHLLQDPFFAKQVKESLPALRKIVIQAIHAGIPVPSLSNAVSYLDMYAARHAGANLIQAQRDYFGAHTFERVDRAGSFHHEWRRSS